LLLEADEPPVADDHVVQEVDAEDLGSLRGGKTVCASPR
jgi:hypothetical protein